MNTSHPNIFPLIGVEIEPDAGKFSMVSEMMTNENIFAYISQYRADRVRLVRPSLVDSSGQIADWSHSWRMLQEASNISTNPESSMEIQRGCVDPSIISPFLGTTVSANSIDLRFDVTG